MTAQILLGGQVATAAVVHVPAQGPWYADVDCEGAPDLSGRQTLLIGALSLSGTVDPRFSGTFGLRRVLRLVAGAGRWGSPLPAKSYHSDGGVRARLVAEDAAREAGETLAAFVPGVDVLGVDFVRRAGPASVTLEQTAAGAPWWVDYDGATRVGAHPETVPASSAYEVLGHDPRARVVEFAADDAGAVRVGATLTDRLDAPVVVRELEITAGESIRLKAWCGPVDTARGRLLDAMRAIVLREVAGRIYGPWRYRVGQMNGDRYELQAVRHDAGLPDVIPCSAWPGLAGSHSIVTPGVECLVEFIEGDPSKPIVTHFAGKDGAAWAPVEAVLAATSMVRLGSATADKALALAHLVNDRVETLRAAWSGHVHTPGTLTSPSGSVTGAMDPATVVAPLASVGSAVVMGVD